MIAGGMLWCYFDEAECCQSVESFFHGEVEGAPAGSQILDDLIREHDNERMGPSSGFKAYEDGTHFEVCSFAGTKRLLDRGQIFVAVVDHLFGCLRGRQVQGKRIWKLRGFSVKVVWCSAI